MCLLSQHKQMPVIAGSSQYGSVDGGGTKQHMRHNRKCGIQNFTSLRGDL